MLHNTSLATFSDGKKNLYRKNDYESTVKMSVCVSVNPVCATNQKLNASELVSSLSVY